MAQQHINYSTPNDGLGDTLRTSQVKAESNFNELYANKVDKVTGKSLTDVNFSQVDKNKLDSLDPNAGVQDDWLQGDNLEPDYIKNKPTNLSDFFNDLPQYLNAVGTFHYADLDTQTTPLNIVSNIALQLENDALGTNTVLTNAPFGIDSVWNTVTNTMDFSQLSIGDALHLRVDATITTSSANQNVKCFVKFGIGSAYEFDLTLSQDLIKTAGVHPLVSEVSFDMAYQEIIENPAKIYVVSDGNATIKINGWYFEILRKNINVIDLITDLGYIPEDLDNKSNGYIVDGTGVKYYTVDYINSLSTDEYSNLFTYITGSQVFTVPESLKVMSVTLNDGRVLKKTIDWIRTSSTVITIIYALEENDTIYITGLI